MTSGDVDPVAGSSSASASIEIKYLEYTFNPVFTHQCFEKEFIPGFAPMEIDEFKAHEITRKCSMKKNMFALVYSELLTVE